MLLKEKISTGGLRTQHLASRDDDDGAMSEDRREAARLAREVLALKLQVTELKNQNEALKKALDDAVSRPQGALKTSLLMKPGGDKRGKGAEQRRYPRHRTRLDSCKILDRHYAVVAECLLRDISESGCRLSLFDKVELPNDFLLYRDRDGVLMNATVRWRANGEFGLLLRNSILRSDPAYPWTKLVDLTQLKPGVVARAR